MSYTPAKKQKAFLEHSNMHTAYYLTKDGFTYYRKRNSLCLFRIKDFGSIQRKHSRCQTFSESMSEWLSYKSFVAVKYQKDDL